MKSFKKQLITASLSIFAYASNAQTAGINRGGQVLSGFTTTLQTYMDPITTLIYVVAAITGMVGAFKVYQEWNGGESRNVMAKAWGWVGACLFLLVANAMLRGFFFA